MLDTVFQMCSNRVPFNLLEIFMAREFGHGDIANAEITHDGVTRTLRDWADMMHIPYATARMRYRRGKRTFSDLFQNIPSRHTSMRVREADEKVVVTHQARTMLDDLLSPDTAEKVREIARQANMSPVQVVQKIVDKKATELLANP
jgi:restriction endonuclease Mrr